MSEQILSIKTLCESLVDMIPTDHVRVFQFEGMIFLAPYKDAVTDECPLLGMALDSSLTVDKFLAMTREDRVLEYE